MKVIHEADGVITLNFAKGDAVMAVLSDFLKERGVTAGHITGLGAASELELAYYNIETKEYERKTFTEDVEVLSLTGNIGVKEGGELVVHIHGTFGRRDFSVFGGHVYEMVISGAGELHVVTMPGTINRTFDEAAGLTLMCPADEVA